MSHSSVRILIIRFSSIGDIVLTTPVLRALKQQLDGDVSIHYITKRGFAGILDPNPYVDKVISIDKHVSEVADQLQQGGYDYIIDLHSNLRSRQVKRSTKALSFTLDKRNLAKWIYVQTKKTLLPIGHIVERSFQAIVPLGVTDDGLGLDYFIPTEEEVSKTALPESLRAGFVAYAIGGQMQGKILPTDQIITLCQKINRPMALLGGKEDAERGAQIAAACGERVWNACGAFSLHQSASIVRLADVVISHDTGLMHIAAALNKRVISLWLATTPKIGMSPWRPGAGSEMIEADCNKRPTSKLGNRGYEDGCVFNIDLDRIAILVNG